MELLNEARGTSQEEIKKEVLSKEAQCCEKFFSHKYFKNAYSHPFAKL